MNSREGGLDLSENPLRTAVHPADHLESLLFVGLSPMSHTGRRSRAEVPITGSSPRTLGNIMRSRRPPSVPTRRLVFIIILQVNHHLNEYEL
jgi:hypothetical protein